MHYYSPKGDNMRQNDTNQAKTEVIENLVGIILFYVVLIGGVLIIDMRMSSLPDYPSSSINMQNKTIGSFICTNRYKIRM